jgi:hypothetical protein
MMVFMKRMVSTFYRLTREVYPRARTDASEQWLIFSEVLNELKSSMTGDIFLEKKEGGLGAGKKATLLDASPRRPGGCDPLHRRLPSHKQRLQGLAHCSFIIIVCLHGCYTINKR